MRPLRSQPSRSLRSHGREIYGTGYPRRAQSMHSCEAVVHASSCRELLRTFPTRRHWERPVRTLQMQAGQSRADGPVVRPGWGTRGEIRQLVFRLEPADTSALILERITFISMHGRLRLTIAYRSSRDWKRAVASTGAR